MKSFLIRYNWFLWAFLCTLALIGPIHAGFYKVVCLLIVPTFIVLYYKELKVWYHEHPAERHYFYGILIFCLYVFLQVAVWSFLPNKYNYEPSYGAIEEFLFTYLLLALLAWVLGVGLTQKMFECIIIAFGVCTALGGMFLLWAYFDLSQLLESPKILISQVLACRFTGCVSTKFPELTVFLKDYSFYPTLGALLLIPFAVKYKGAKRWLIALLALINACLLIFTINRGTIIGFSIALVLMVIYFSWKLVWYKKMTALLCVIATVVLIVEFMPQEIKMRFLQMIRESEAFIQEEHDSGSISARLKMWEILLSHKQDFWLLGEGPLYGTDRLRAYFMEADYQYYVDMGFVYHNQYLAYFHHYGILGLLFLPFLLFYPLYAMIRYRRFSVTLTAIIIIFAFACIEDRYLGKTMVEAVLFVFFFSYFQLDKWRYIENKNYNDVEPIKSDSKK
ncbi:MAG: O-antigen ligase family protein [Bacteroidales bacterium]|jgi:hypothetical protein|nr:O-antigen ligase family protein [Bacteroidales bacterium]